MDVLVLGVNFFYQPLEGEVVEHQYLVLVSPFDHGRHEYLYFLLFHLESLVLFFKWMGSMVWAEADGLDAEPWMGSCLGSFAFFLI